MKYLIVSCPNLNKKLWNDLGETKCYNYKELEHWNVVKFKMVQNHMWVLITKELMSPSKCNQQCEIKQTLG